MNMFLFITRGIIVGGVFLYFLLLLNAHIPFAGTKEFTYTFGELNGTLTALQPLARVEGVVGDRSAGPQLVREDPVYFDIRTRIPYDTATFQLEYQNKTPFPVSMGIKKGDEAWSFATTPFARTQKSDGWEQGILTLDLSQGVRSGNKYTFVISIPGLTIEKRDEYVAVRTLRVTLQGRPLSVSSLFAFFQSFL